jgi:CBS-domain-containing membrane protein
MNAPILFSMIHCTLCVAAQGACAIWLGEPLVIPAVGASAYLVFSAPRHEVAAPRNVILGHTLGATIGWVMLWVFRLQDTHGGQIALLTVPRVAAVACALGLTIGVLRTLKASHPPAGATTMIVAIGALPQARHIPDFVVSALIVVVYAALALRLSGIEYPLWKHRPLLQES